MAYTPPNPNGQATMANSSPVVIASNQSALPTNADGTVAAGTAATKSFLGGLVYNTSAPAPTNGQQVAFQGDSAGNLFTNPGALAAANDSVTIGGGLMPTGTALNPYSVRITTNTTTTPTSATAYIELIVITVETAGTTSTVTIRDKQGTPVVLVSAFSTGALLSGGDAIFSYPRGAKMVSGIDIVTSGSVAAALSIFINYFQ